MGIMGLSMPSLRRAATTKGSAVRPASVSSQNTAWKCSMRQQFQGAARLLDMDDLADAGNVHHRTQQLQGMGLGAHHQHAMCRKIRPIHEITHLPA